MERIKSKIWKHRYFKQEEKKKKNIYKNEFHLLVSWDPCTWTVVSTVTAVRKLTKLLEFSESPWTLFIPTITKTKTERTERATNAKAPLDPIEKDVCTNGNLKLVKNFAKLEIVQEHGGCPGFRCQRLVENRGESEFSSTSSQRPNAEWWLDDVSSHVWHCVPSADEASRKETRETSSYWWYSAGFHQRLWIMHPCACHLWLSRGGVGFGYLATSSACGEACLERHGVCSDLRHATYVFGLFSILQNKALKK